MCRLLTEFQLDWIDSHAVCLGQRIQGVSINVVRIDEGFRGVGGGFTCGLGYVAEGGESVRELDFDTAESDSHDPSGQPIGEKSDGSQHQRADRNGYQDFQRRDCTWLDDERQQSASSPSDAGSITASRF